MLNSPNFLSHRTVSGAVVSQINDLRLLFKINVHKCAELLSSVRMCARWRVAGSRLSGAELRGALINNWELIVRCGWNDRNAKAPSPCGIKSRAEGRRERMRRRKRKREGRCVLKKWIQSSRSSSPSAGCLCHVKELVVVFCCAASGHLNAQFL